MDMKTLAEWEKEKNWIYKAATPELLNKQMTEDEFIELLTSDHNNFHGVNHADRIEFLQNNGHQVTRENMVNHKLSTGGTIIEE